MSYARSLAVFLTAIVMIPSLAFAQEGGESTEKIQIVVIDSDPRDKGKAYRPIEKALEARDDVNVMSEADFLKSAKSRDVTLKTLRKGSEREKHENEIAGAMSDAGVEIVIVVDAIKKRRHAQAVVLGPKGKELADIREKLTRLKSNKNVDKYILDEAFKVAQDEVADHRKMLAKQRQEKLEREAALAQAEAESSAAANAEVSQSVETDSGSMDSSDPAFSLTASGLIGQRVFSAEAAESSYQIDHTAPLAGGSLELGFRFASFGAGSVGFEAQGDYAPMSIEFIADGGEPFTVSGHHVAGRGELVYMHRLGGAFMRIGLGADAISSTLDPNSYFTGTRYIAGRATVGGGFGQADGLMVRLVGGVLPVLANNTSGNAYGEAPFGLAYTGQARVSYGLTRTLSMQLGYDLRFYSNEFDEPPIASSTVATTDLIHGGSIGIGFRM